MVANTQSQLHSAHFYATPIQLTYTSPQESVCLCSVYLSSSFGLKFVCLDTPPQSPPITEYFTSIQVVIPLWIGAEFPDTVVLWLAETRTVGVEL